jgi:hypothetical protein
MNIVQPQLAPPADFAVLRSGTINCIGCQLSSGEKLNQRISVIESSVLANAEFCVKSAIVKAVTTPAKIAANSHLPLILISP